MSRGKAKGGDGAEQPFVEQLRAHRAFLFTACFLALIVITVGFVFVVQNGPSANTPRGRAEPSPSPMRLPLLGLDPALAADPIHHQVVLFNRSGETWLWSGMAWTRARYSDGPRGRDSGTAMAWDFELGEALLFGGEGSGGPDDLPRDTWAWTGASWHRVDDGASGPHGGWAAMAYDPIRKQMVLIVSTILEGTATTQTWTWSSGHWQLQKADGPAGAVLAAGFDPRSRAVLVVSAQCSASGCMSRASTWNGLSWRQLVAAHQPTASVHMTLAHDPVSDQLLLLTEPNVPYGTSAQTETWSWNGSDWIQQSSVGQPNGIVYSAGSGDDRTDALFAFEDVTPLTGADRVVAAWAWTGASWVPAPQVTKGT
jgi:hypothetical protein